MSVKEVLNYWFGEIRETEEYLNARREMWFFGKPEVDQEITTRFGALLDAVKTTERLEWAGYPTGRLAAIIVLDQFSRNVYRGDPKAFAQDPMALQLCLEGLDLNADKTLHPIQRSFFYLPLEHSEQLPLQERSLQCYAQLLKDAPVHLKKNFEENMTYAVRHYEIIQRFGRFPHRNKVLGRVSTAEELEFLTQPNSSF